MNLNLKTNQKREPKLKKSEQREKQQKENTQQQLKQQEQQQVATTLLQDKQAEKQQLGWAKLPDQKLLKAAGLTAEKLKNYPGFAGFNEEERENIAEALILFSQLAYEIFLQQQEATSSNKATAGSKQRTAQQSPPTIKKLKPTFSANKNCLKKRVK